MSSNIFKNGFDNIKTISTDPFVIDTNSRVIEIPQGRVIRSQKEIKENAPESEKEDVKKPDNEELLGDAMDKAQDILEESREKANAILAQAQQEADALMEQAKQEGYNRGLEEGNMEAMKRADVYLEKIEEEKSVFMQNYDKEAEEKIAEAEKKMVELSCRLIEKMTGMLVDEYQPVMLHMINQSLLEQEASRKFIIRVAEESFAYINDNYDRLVGATNPSIELEVFGDAKLTRRQCQIESDNGIIDLSMDVQVNNLIKAFKLLCDKN